MKFFIKINDIYQLELLNNFSNPISEEDKKNIKLENVILGELKKSIANPWLRPSFYKIKIIPFTNDFFSNSTRHILDKLLLIDNNQNQRWIIIDLPNSVVSILQKEESAKGLLEVLSLEPIDYETSYYFRNTFSEEVRHNFNLLKDIYIAHFIRDGIFDEVEELIFKIELLIKSIGIVSNNGDGYEKLLIAIWVEYILFILKDIQKKSEISLFHILEDLNQIVVDNKIFEVINIKDKEESKNISIETFQNNLSKFYYHNLFALSLDDSEYLKNGIDTKRQDEIVFLYQASIFRTKELLLYFIVSRMKVIAGGNFLRLNRSQISYLNSKSRKLSYAFLFKFLNELGSENGEKEAYFYYYSKLQELEAFFDSSENFNSEEVLNLFDSIVNFLKVSQLGETIYIDLSEMYFDIEMSQITPFSFHNMSMPENMIFRFYCLPIQEPYTSSDYIIGEFKHTNGGITLKQVYYNSNVYPYREIGTELYYIKGILPLSRAY